MVALMLSHGSPNGETVVLCYKSLLSKNQREQSGVTSLWWSETLYRLYIG